MTDSGGPASPDGRRAPTELLRDLVGPWWLRIGVLGFTSLVGGLAEAGVLVMVARAAFAIARDDGEVDLLGGYSLSLGTTLAVAAALLGLRIVAGILSAEQTARITVGVVARTRRDLVTAYFRADWAITHVDASGRLQELLTTFSSESAALAYMVGKLIVTAASLVALLVVAAAVDAVAALVALVVYGVLALVMRPLRVAVRREAAHNAAAELDLTSRVAEFTRLDLETRVFGVEGRVEEDLESLIESSATSSRRVRFLSELAYPTVVSLLYATIIGALAVVRSTEPADLSSIGAVLLILLRSFGYAQDLQTSFVFASSNLPFVEQLNDELARYRAAGGPSRDLSLEGVSAISLESVWFEYVAGVPALRGVSASLGPGEIVGVVGPSGAGKSTLVHLLLGLRRPSRGRVLVAGRDIGRIRREEWSRLVGFVPQQPNLFAGSVADNIRFFRDWIGDEAVERAARLAHVHDEIVGWEGGYDHQVGARGGALSVGQQQRITIARVLAGDPELLVLDEPTSALDPHNDFLVRRSLEGLRGTMTIVIVAHRLSTLDVCDRIMVVQEGELRALDTPANLRRDTGFYREILELSGLA